MAEKSTRSTPQPPARGDPLRQPHRYPPDTAGGIMTTRLTALPARLTVEQAIGELRRRSEQLEPAFYVYVVDEQHRLVGVLSMRDLVLAGPAAPLQAVMQTRVLSVPVTMDQERVAALARKYGYL